VSTKPKPKSLYHFTGDEEYRRIKVSGFRGQVWLAEEPRTVWGASHGVVLLEVCLDMDTESLARYRVPVEWDGPSEFECYFRVPARIVNACAKVRRVSTAQRKRLMI
jgi:hypothetical protein